MIFSIINIYEAPTPYSHVVIFFNVNQINVFLEEKAFFLVQS